ncbi:NAD(P)-dependent oxidoreductase [Polynucleobacter sp. 80A-SIGWE]|uniref:NAD-dependent epimerase/dehydratase family protein n=1 Tax=Polynucleobacter sp. 80A-SIGWE TaxID=2689100 RepID=UPI001C0D62EB|nr:NAD(P)-dependent oxidoreductase [Polynucleobacter sp. 80A-SIGWE]MBU3589080.1 NAD(P)-dependent oxidoreductase [Polynucleobacter sp. 80A-SIGWE]
MSLEKNYFEKYFFNHINRAAFKDVIGRSDFHIFGGTGALGLSLLYLFQHFDLTPASLTLYGRNSSKFNEWEKYAIDISIPFKSVKSESLNNVDLTSITKGSTVIYFPGYAQPVKFMANPGSLFDLNITTLKNIIERAPRQVFYSSTTEIYTGLSGRVAEESHTVSTPSHPRGAYIESKRGGEAILAHCALPNTRAVSFRVALATPPSHIPGDNRILSDIVASALNKHVIQLKGGWDSIRQYQWGPICIAKILYSGFFGMQNLYNIAGGESITLGHLAQSVACKLEVPYVNRVESSEQDIGAPPSVDISTKRFEGEFSLALPIESLHEMLDVYLQGVK